MPRMTSNSTSSKQTRFAKNILPSMISGHCRHALLVTKLLVEGIVIRPHGGNTAITTSDAHIRSHLYYHNPQSLTPPKLEYHGNDTPNHTRSNIKHLITQDSTQPHHGKFSKTTSKQNKTKLALVFSTGALIPKCNTPISRVSRRKHFPKTRTNLSRL